MIVSTLLDREHYPDKANAGLYLHRWQVEFNFRDIKTTLGMNVLHSQTPLMIKKKVQIQTIDYNMVQLPMLEAARLHELFPARLPFKGTESALRTFAPLMSAHARGAAAQFEDLLLALAANLVTHHPDRSKPRRHIRVSKSRKLK